MIDDQTESILFCGLMASIVYTILMLVWMAKREQAIHDEWRERLLTRERTHTMGGEPPQEQDHGATGTHQ